MATEITIQEYPNPLGSRRLILYVEGNRHEVTVTASASFAEGWMIYYTDMVRNRYYKDKRFVAAIGVTGSAQAQTLQLFVHNSCLVFQLNHSHDVPASLRPFLEDSSIFFVSYRSEHLLSKLRQSRHRLNMARIPFDIAESAIRYLDRQAIRLTRIEDIARYNLGILGVTMPIAVDSSDWVVEHLSVGQVKQLALEAYITYRYTMMNISDHIS